MNIPGNSVVVRRLRAEDTEAAYALYQMNTFGVCLTVEQFRRIPVMPQIQMFVALDADLLVGLTLTYDCGFFGYLDCIIVHPDHRRKHIGRTLLEAVLRHPIQEFVTPWEYVALCNRTSDRGIAKFCEASGFEICSKKDYVWRARDTQH